MTAIITRQNERLLATQTQTFHFVTQVVIRQVHFMALHLGVFYVHGDLICLKKKRGTLPTLQTLGFPTLNFKNYNLSQW